MDQVRRQYEAYPYPERDPSDEARRLIEGSPSHPGEIDHFLYGGARDWSRPFRALVAGGGTGDGLILLAQKLADAGRPAEIVYLDLSEASRAVAEARAAARGLASIRFVTGDLLDAADHGPFDYVDCCGVLHHLADPQAGFDALAGALAEDGGMGCMVYAPLGRTGVYPLQEAFGRLAGGLSPAAQVAFARRALAALPASHWFRRNPLLGDHLASDAGLYDLLLHSRDRPFAAEEVFDAVERAGLRLVSFIAPARYAPETWIGALAAPAGDMEARTRAGLAERLAGNIKAHAFYAAKPGAKGVAQLAPGARPRLIGVTARALAAETAKRGAARATLDGHAHALALPKAAAPLVARLDGRMRLGEIAAAAGLDWLAFADAFAPVHRALTGFGLLRYSETFQ